MARVLGLWFWLSAAATIAVLLSSAFDWAFINIFRFVSADESFDFGITPRLIGMAVALIVMALLAPSARRCLWRVPILRDWLRKQLFEDIDGTWKGTIESNWPVIEKMLDVSSHRVSSSFDPIERPEQIPPLKKVSAFSVKLNMGWDKVSAEFLPNDDSPLASSRTIAVELIRPCAEYPARIFLGFHQRNSEVSKTDEDNFIGAAMLDVISSNMLEGVYWNNRSWRSGLNAAGRITLERVENENQQ